MQLLEIEQFKTMKEEWITACNEDDLVIGSGVCVLLKGRQVALFRPGKDQAVYAISNHDPFSEANILSRGIIGSIRERLVVASPLYKQHFCLKTGQCLEHEEVSVKAYPARIQDGKVQLAI